MVFGLQRSRCMRTFCLAPLLAYVLRALACGTEVGGKSTPPPGEDDGGGSEDDSGGSEDDGAPGGGDSGGGGGDECPSIDVALAAVTPTVVLLIDRSGTMTQGFGPTDRWSAVFSTLMDQNTGLVKRLGQSVRFGVMLYTGSDQRLPGSPCPIIEQVPPALNNYQTILGVYSPLEPIEDTPTAPSLALAQASLEAVTERGPKIIVLATDGLPDTCADPDPDGQPGALVESIAAARAAHDRNIDVYVISVGNQVTDAHLQDMANAGVGLPVGGSERAPFYKALEPGALEDAFNTIIGGVRSCTFTLDGRVDLQRADSGTVTLDGTALEYEVGWRLRDESTLELIGAACETILAGGEHEVTAEFECGGVIVD